MFRLRASVNALLHKFQSDLAGFIVSGHLFFVVFPLFLPSNLIWYFVQKLCRFLATLSFGATFCTYLLFGVLACDTIIWGFFSLFLCPLLIVGPLPFCCHEFWFCDGDILAKCVLSKTLSTVVCRLLGYQIGFLTSHSLSKSLCRKPESQEPGWVLYYSIMS